MNAQKMCVCVIEREREREREGWKYMKLLHCSRDRGDYWCVKTPDVSGTNNVMIV